MMIGSVMVNEVKMKIAVHGVNGKMGQAIAQSVILDDTVELSGVSVRASHDWHGRSLHEVSGLDSDIKTTANLEVLCQRSDVIIDFTRPDATLALLSICERYDRPVMIGTTGFTPDAIQWIENAARRIPIVLAANTSLGVNVLMALTRRVASILPATEWDIEISEAHHRRKVDAPSGTALKLGEAAANGRGVDFTSVKVYPHESKARQMGDIGFSVIRGGDVVGDHTVFYLHDYERIELTHRAQDRRVFAHGAVIAAKWLAGKPAGLYSMADVLGFNW